MSQNLFPDASATPDAWPATDRPLQAERGVGLLVIEALMSNPNGDPDKESDPRTLSHDGRGVISAVSFKRKLRDLVLEKDGVAWRVLQGEMGLDPARFGILEDRALKRSDATKLLQGEKGENRRKGNYREFHSTFWDARVFGNTFLEGTKEEGDEEQKANLRQSVRNGVVQFTNAISVSRVEIERATNTKKAGAQEGKDRGMAPLADRVVKHGVYAMPFFVNPALAHRTHCTAEDVLVLLRLLRAAYPLTASKARPCVTVRHAFYMEHLSPLGSVNDLDVIAHFTPRRKVDDQTAPSAEWNDYEINTDLGVFQDKVKGFRDWAQD